MDASVRSPQVVNHATPKPIYGFTNVQRIFVLAAAVAVVAATVFALQSLGIPQAVTVGGILGCTTLISLSEYVRVRMVNLSRIKSYNHSEWALFPQGFFSHANSVIRLRKVKRHSSSGADTPRLPQVTVNAVPVLNLPAPVTAHRPKTSHRTHKSTTSHVRSK